MPSLADLLLLALVLVGYPVWDYYVAWPRARARLEAGDPRARVQLYQAAILTQWMAAALVIALWIGNRRPAHDLWLALPGGWRLAAGLTMAFLGIGLMAAQAAGASRASEETRVALRPRLAYALPILPRTIAERRWFMLLSLTAGACEELLYRGFVVWALAPWLGLWGAAAASVAGFGIAHAYLGRTGVLRATLAGVVFGAAALALGSLYPGMLLHAALDMGAGAVGYALLHEGSR